MQIELMRTNSDKLIFFQNSSKELSSILTIIRINFLVNYHLDTSLIYIQPKWKYFIVFMNCNSLFASIKLLMLNTGCRVMNVLR